MGIENPPAPTDLPPLRKGEGESERSEQSSLFCKEGLAVSEMGDLHWMRKALELAKLAEEKGEVPVGALIVRDNQVIGQGYNQPIATHDPSAHAEIQAIRQACLHAKNYRLTNTTMYVTLEPCAMCAGAIIHARITRVVFGATDPRTGAAGSVFNILQEPLLNHRCQVSAGIEKEACAHILKNFFKNKRAVV